MRPVALLIVSGMAFLLISCKSGTWTSGRVDAVTELHLLGTPVAVDLDGNPGPDGVGVRVYASSGKTPEAVRITSGTLVISIFDGAVETPNTAGARKLASFSYSAEELRKFEHPTAVGIAYNFLPTWGTEQPKKSRVTVIATYKGTSGQVIHSPPITVPLGKR